MEVVNPAGHHEHKWLKWVGLQEPPPGADTWVPVARGFVVNDLSAERLVNMLSAAGIEGAQRSYVANHSPRVGVGAVGSTEVAVVVHNRDRARATELAVDLKHEIDRIEQQRLSPDGVAELTHMAMEAGPPPPAG